MKRLAVLVLLLAPMMARGQSHPHANDVHPYRDPAPMGQMAYFNITGTSVTIAAQSNGSTNLVKAVVTSTIQDGSQGFDNGGADNGRLRYTGTRTKMFHIAATFTIRAATGLDVFVACVAKNGVALQDSKVLVTLSTGVDHGASLHAYTDLVNGDYIELFVGNTTAPRNMTVKSVQVFAMGME